MIFPSEAKCYKSYDGEYLVTTNDGLGDGNYFSPDGKTFYQLKQTSYGNKGFDFEEPRRNLFGCRVHFVDDHLVLDDKRLSKRIYRLAQIPEPYEVLPIPNIRVAFSFGCLQKIGELFYVSMDKYYQDPIKFFKGYPEAMKEVTIEIATVRGGIWKIFTKEGQLESSNTGMIWEGIILAPARQALYETITETEEGLTIKEINPARKGAREIAFTVTENS